MSPLVLMMLQPRSIFLTSFPMNYGLKVNVVLFPLFLDLQRRAGRASQTSGLQVELAKLLGF